MSSPVISNQSAELLRAFLQAEYAVSVGGREYVVRIGQHHPDLDAAIAHIDWGIVTPVNPGGRQIEDTANAQRCRELAAEIDNDGLTRFSARNRDPRGHWPDEPGFLVTGVDRKQLDRLARRFGQAGIVTGRPGQAALLRLYGNGWPHNLPACTELAG